jgi:hypothetical protein
MKLIKKYSNELVSNYKHEDVMEARKQLDKVKSSKSKYTFGGKNKQSVIDQREGALKKLLVKHEVFPTPKGFDLIKDATFQGVVLNLQLGYKMVFSESQMEVINQLKIDDKNWIVSQMGQDKEKEIIKSHINNENMVITKRSHSFSMDDNELFADSSYTMRSRADDIANPFQDCYESKRLMESRTEEEGIESMTKSELKLLCKKNNLKVSGSKSELIKRLSN